MKNSSTDSARKKLRKELRATRRGLSKSQQECAARQLARNLRSHPLFLRSKRIAFYMADDGEINVHHLINAAEKMGKQCYLPILHPLKDNSLWFGRYRKGDTLLLNHFNLAEPSPTQPLLPAWMLDLVLMPLVGFDRQGNRLGMGGGFYDRTFAFKRSTTKNSAIKNSTSRKPILIGIAHQCQETQSLESENWDVPLDYVATDKEIIIAN